LRFRNWEFPDDLLYDTAHCWVRIEGNVAVVGITDFGRYLMGDLVYVELPPVGSVYRRGDPCGSVESGKWVGRISAPMGGKVVKVNEEVKENPFLVNEDPYGKGWLFALQYDDTKELAELLCGPRYLDWVAEAAAREGIEEGIV